MSGAKLEAGIERIMLADLSPEEAIPVFRELLEEDPESFPIRVYNALSVAAVRILTARRTVELREWTDLIRQASSLVRSRGNAALGERLQALSDLTTTWTRMSEAHPAKEILERPHCRAILEEIRRHGSKAQRKDIIAAVKIGEANLSRILGSLEAVGLINRDNRRVRTITLTPEGEHLLGPVQEKTERPTQRPVPEARVFRGRGINPDSVIVREHWSAERPKRRCLEPGLPREFQMRKERRSKAKSGSGHPSPVLPRYNTIKEEVLERVSLFAMAAEKAIVDEDDAYPLAVHMHTRLVAE